MSGFALRKASYPPVSTLNTLTLSGVRHFMAGAAAGTSANASLVGSTFGSTISFLVADPHIALSGPNVLVGSTSSVSGTITFSTVETLAGAIGSPKISGPFTLTVDAASLGYGNDGTGVRPSGAIDVSSYAAIYAALGTVAPGGTIYLAAGDYPELTFNTAYRYADPGIKIMGQTGVHVANIVLDGSWGISFEYMDIVSLSTDQSRGVSLGNGLRLGVKHLTVNPSNSNSVGIFFNDCDTLDILNNLVDGVGEGITCYGSSTFGNQNIRIANNKIPNNGDNGLLIIRAQHVKILSNFVGPMALTDPTAHPDSIQLQTVDDVEVGYNNFDFTGSTGPVNHCGGIGFSETVTNFFYHHNASFGADDNGMSFGGATCAFGVVEDNFSQGVVYSGRIIIRDGSHDVVFNRNQVSLVPPIVVYDPPGLTYNLTMGTGIDANVTIPGAADFTDKSRYNAFVASNPLIAVP